MNVFGFTLDTIAHRPVVILKDAEDTNTVPIWISASEAACLATELIGRDILSQNSRGDLLSVLLERLAMSVTTISIDTLREGAFTASIRVAGDGGELRLEVRPYEALITALKFKLPVMVADEVMARASMLALDNETIARENDERRYVEFLENLDPAELGKYPM
jgi:bifunctional DNase/RNase